MEKLTKREIGILEPGTILQNIGNGDSYVVTTNDGNISVAVKTLTVTNPSEWMIVSRPKRVG